MEWLQNQDLKVVILASAGAGVLLTGLGFLGIKGLKNHSARGRKGKGVFKLYHQHTFRSSRCLWLIEGKLEEKSYNVLMDILKVKSPLKKVFALSLYCELQTYENLSMKYLVLHNGSGYQKLLLQVSLSELGMKDDFEVITYNPYKATEEERADYKANVNAHGTVPSFVTPEGQVMTEGVAICLYIADLYQKLLPHQSEKHNYYK